FAPSTNGGAAISDYTVEFSTDGTTWTVFDDGVSANLSSTVTSLTNNTSYQFRVKAVNTAGSGESSNVVSARPFALGANDPFAGGIALVGNAGAVVDSTLLATRETGEPTHGGFGGAASIWYRFTAPGNGVLSVTTQGSNFDTLLGVYSGSALNALTVLGANDDAPKLGVLWSKVEGNVVAGTEYSIAVDGWNARKGAVKLNWSFVASTLPIGPSVPTAPLALAAVPTNNAVALTWNIPSS
ncbi:MAG: fibronectin type III domain-containing protein, partial [Ilumatobacteraceae bacterium]|nr:fibronectin type III domain-containing protein [Ilumatobacteraceae bacterium]